MVKRGNPLSRLGESRIANFGSGIAPFSDGGKRKAMGKKQESDPKNPTKAQKDWQKSRRMPAG